MQIRQSCISLEFLGGLGNCTLHRFLGLEFVGMLKNLSQGTVLNKGWDFCESLRMDFLRLSMTVQAQISWNF